ncbi:small heat shock protein [Coprinopsis sp. MPI-PUGE-AT-0042]|nr:small heat shock protein [Coprinopsis sp. MPI-PUGE-AT-0042]
MSGNVFLYEPFYDFDRFLDEAFSGRRPQHNSNGRQLQRSAEPDGAVRHFKPRMDLHEDSEKNVVTATFELPGLKKEDVSLDVRNDRLTVSAESKVSNDHDVNGYAVRERRYGKISRTLQMPGGLKEEDIKANMQDGLLTITFPKSAPELAPKKITIS